MSIFFSAELFCIVHKFRYMSLNKVEIRVFVLVKNTAFLLRNIVKELWIANILHIRIHIMKHLCEAIL